MSDNPDTKQTEEVANTEATELEEGDLHDVSGGTTVLGLQKLEVPTAGEAEMPAGSCTSSVSSCCLSQNSEFS